MKISKVNHKRAAVVSKEASTKGILYRVPDGKDKGQSLTDYIQNTLNKNAEFLYNVLINPANKSQYSKDELEVLRKFNQVMKGVLKTFRSDGKTKVQYQIDILRMSFGLLEKKNQHVVEVSTFQRNNNLDYKEVANKLIINTLRSSLRKTITKQVNGEIVEVNLPEILEKIMLAMCAGKQAGEEFQAIKEADLRSLLKYMKEDYTKVAQSKEIAKSIENQNVKAQVVEKDGGYYLKTSKKEEYLFEFLQEYAHGNAKERNEKLMEMKKLFILFFYGPEEYETVREANVSIRGSYKPQNAVELSFSPAVDIIIQDEVQNPDDTKSKKKARSEAIKREIRKSIMEHYRAAIQIKELTNADKFWLEYIERFTEKELKFKANLPFHKLENAYLLERGWKEFQSYIAMKYVDIGKAVYHFVIPKDFKGEISLGEVMEKFHSGLTSFDYERIKAEDEFERSLMTYIAFATHAFSNAILVNESDIEDVLICKEDKLKSNIRKDAQKNILAYFGGYSKWADEPWIKQDDNADESRTELVWEIKEQLKNVRNGVFHYTAEVKANDIKKDSKIMQLFCKELNDLGSVYRKKYYSNNVWMFYDKKNLDALMNELYQDKETIIEQFPSFEKVLKRSILNSVWSINETNWTNLQKCQDGRAEKYWSSVYFLLKEIYYQEFLKQDNLFGKFENALNEIEKQITDKNEKLAMENFKKRVSDIKNANKEISFGVLCQQILTDYNMQNPNGKQILSNEQEKNQEKFYEHFPMILHRGIREAFLKYVSKYNWLKQPKVCEICSEEEFCQSWTLNTNKFAGLSEVIKNDQTLGGWYVISHFLTPKYLNHLVGDIKNYIQYVTNIKNRESTVVEANKRHVVLEQINIQRYKTVLKILEFSREFCGRTSNCIEDYFDNYAEYVSHYVDFGNVISNDTLAAFCAQPVKESPSGYVGIYYDGRNAIPNRNIILAKLYGSEKLMAQALENDKITENEIRAFYRLNNSLKAVYVKGQCDNENERKNLTKCQQAKNRIELRDIVTYTEIINDLMSQLISWCYLRERDLMYFQLGVHYLRLFYGSEEQRNAIEEKYRSLEKPGKIKIAEGALLYQIAAMHTYSMPVYYWKIDENGNRKLAPQEGQTSLKIGAFVKYCQDKGETYNTCLELFQYMAEEKPIISLRNEIDHFKYYTHMNKSVLDMYNEIFDRFFTYDQKLKKSVSYIFKNILMNYSVIARTSLQEHMVSCDLPKGYCRKTSIMQLCEKDGLKSDLFTYKFEQKPSGRNAEFGKNGSKEVKVEARSEKFLEQLRKILEYSSEN